MIFYGVIEINGNELDDDYLTKGGVDRSGASTDMPGLTIIGILPDVPS